MSCPACGSSLELDGDGGWCPKCEDYFPNDIINDSMDEEDGSFDDTEWDEERGKYR